VSVRMENQGDLLLIPGPTPVHPFILNSLSLPTLSHTSPVFGAEFRQVLSDLKEIVDCCWGEAFLIPGSGTLAMEAALLNTVAPGERLLVLSQGYFGERMAAIAGAFGLDHDLLQSEPRKAVAPERLKEALLRRDYAAVAATHVDTATGVCAPIREYARVLQGFRSLFLVDGVCSTGGIEEKMDSWGLDVVLTAAQKCFGAPPGLAVLVLSERAMEKRKKMGSIPAYSADLLNWLPVMRDPAKYFSTPCVNEIRAFREALRMALAEGLKNRFARHSRMADAVRSAMRSWGFSFYPEEEFLADTLSVVRYPAGIEDGPFRRELRKHGVVVAGGLGNLAGSVFRMGHMGNLTGGQVLFALEAVEKTLKALGYSVKPGAGIEAARSRFDIP